MTVLSPISDYPAWGSGIGRRSPQSIWLWRPVGLECRGSTGMGETETLLLEGAHKVSCTLGPRPKQWLHRSLGQTFLWVLEHLLGRWESAVARCGGKDTGGRPPREYWLAWAVPEVTILAMRLGPNQQPSGSSAGMLQAKNKQGGNTALPRANRLPKVILSQQPRINIPLDTALPTRRKRPSSTHQWAGASSSHQEACTSPWTNLAHQEADTRTKKNYNPTAWGMETTTQKVRQNEMAEKHVPDKGTR